MGVVFVNYRAKDNPLGAAGIHDMLARRFGVDKVFRDSVSMAAGDHYPTKLREGLERADVLVAVIGPRWNELTDEHGARLIQRDKDWVRWEIARAIERGIPIVPVLLRDVPDDAEPPDRAILPSSIRKLADCQTFDISQKRFGADLDRLADRLVELVPSLVLPDLFATAPPHRTADSAPSTLLRPEYGVVPFEGREPQLADLLSWATSGPGVAMRLMVGPAGCGKTRLAMRLCAMLAADGWLAGLVSEDAVPARFGRTDSPLLLVVDSLSRDLAALTATLGNRGRLRLLMLCRAPGAWPAERVSSAFAARDTMVLDSGIADPQVAFAHAFAAFARELGGAGTPTPDLTACRTLLDVHAVALDTALGGSTAPEDGPLARILRRDRAHRLRLAGDIASADLDAISTLATLCRPATAAQAGAVRGRLANFLGDSRYSVDDHVVVFARMYPDQYSPAPLRPAALGEEQVARTLAERPSIVVTLAADCTDEQITNALTVLGHAHVRHPELAGVIQDLLSADPGRLVPIALGMVERLPAPEEFARLIGAAVGKSRMAPDSIFALMDQLGRSADPSADPVRAAVLRSLINDWATPLIDRAQRHSNVPDTPLTASLSQMTDRLQNTLLDAATGFLDPRSGVFPKAPEGTEFVSSDLLSSLRMLMRWRDKGNENPPG